MLMGLYRGELLKESVKIDPLVFMGTHYARVTGNLGRAFSIGKEMVV